MRGVLRFLLQSARSFVTNLLDIWAIAYAHLLYQIWGIEGVSHYLKTLRNPILVLKAFGAEIGEGTIVYPGVVIHAATQGFSNLRVGKNCRIGRECFFDLTEPITIEDTVNVGMRSMLITHVNVADSPLGEGELARRCAPITLKHGAVTFAGVTILMGVTVGECAVIAAGSVVSTDVQPWTLVGGNPARFIRRLDGASATGG